MIDKPLASFLEEGLGINVGTRNEHREPNGARANAVKVADDRVYLSVYMSTIAAERLLPDLEANGQAAIVFGRPIDERACQVKARFLHTRLATDDEREFVVAQWNRYRDNLASIGIPHAATASWITWPSVVIRLQATAVFEQTPGPGAGTQLA